jgi:hypothetical protein
MTELFTASRGRLIIPLRLYVKDEFGRYVERLLRQMDALLEEGVGKLSLREAALAAEE